MLRIITKSSLFLALLSVAATSYGVSKPQIVVRSEIVALSDKLTLGDIAEIVSADQATTALLQNINLGYSPQVGMVRQITRDRIVIALAAAGFSIDSVDIKAPTQVAIRRKSQLVDLLLVREAVERATLADFLARGANAQLSKLDLPPRLEVRTGVVQVRASAGKVKNLFAPFSVSIEILVDGQIARRLCVSAQLDATAEVVVAASDLAANAPLRASECQFAIVKLERDLATYIFDRRQLRGMTLTRSIPKGQPITSDALVPNIVVKAGDVVRIIADSPKLSIALTGEARGAGHVGDRIQVKNLQSGTVLQAIVVDEGIVSVRF